MTMMSRRFEMLYVCSHVCPDCNEEFSCGKRPWDCRLPGRWTSCESCMAEESLRRYREYCDDGTLVLLRKVAAGGR